MQFDLPNWKTRNFIQHLGLKTNLVVYHKLSTMIYHDILVALLLEYDCNSI